MKLRWTAHAIHSLAAREIDREEADRAFREPSATISGHGDRTMFVRRYQDALLGEEMLLCVVTEQQGDEVVIITVYKTSKLDKYLKRGKA